MRVPRTLNVFVQALREQVLVIELRNLDTITARLYEADSKGNMLLESGVYEGFAEEAPQFRFDQLFLNARFVRMIRLPDAMDVHSTTTRYLGEIRRARSLYKRRMRPDKPGVKRPTAAAAQASSS